MTKRELLAASQAALDKTHEIQAEARALPLWRFRKRREREDAAEVSRRDALAFLERAEQLPG